MTRVGLLARADCGGLAAQTFELWRHLRPARTVVMDLGPDGRGSVDLGLYEPNSTQEVRVNRGKVLDDPAFGWLLDGIDVLVTVESDYWRPSLFDECTRAGVRTVLQTNPELHKDRYDAADVILNPTGWEHDRLPDTATIFPAPVARDRLAWEVRRRARVFFHPWAPAMDDRNGTELVLAALPYIHEEITLIVRAPSDVRLPRHVGPVTVVHLDDTPAHYWDAWPEADVLLLPRRYGGLSLPMQEALSLGMPVVSLDVAPQHEWPGVFSVPAHLDHRARMAGGVFDVHGCDPRDLAGAVDELAISPTLVEGLSNGADFHADAIDWRYWARRWRALLERTVHGRHAA